MLIKIEDMALTSDNALVRGGDSRIGIEPNPTPMPRPWSLRGFEIGPIGLRGVERVGLLPTPSP